MTRVSKTAASGNGDGLGKAMLYLRDLRAERGGESLASSERNRASTSDPIATGKTDPFRDEKGPGEMNVRKLWHLWRGRRRWRWSSRKWFARFGS